MKKFALVASLFWVLLAGIAGIAGNAIAAYPGDFHISIYGGASSFSGVQAYVYGFDPDSVSTMGMEVDKGDLLVPFDPTLGLSGRLEFEFSPSRFLRTVINADYLTHSIDFMGNSVTTPGATSGDASKPPATLSKFKFMGVGFGVYGDFENDTNFTPTLGLVVGFGKASLQSGADSSVSAGSNNIVVTYEVNGGVDVILSNKMICSIGVKKRFLRAGSRFSVQETRDYQASTSIDIPQDAVFTVELPKMNSLEGAIGIKFLLN